MGTKQKQTTAGSSSKAKLQENKSLLPDKPKKTENIAPGPVLDKKDNISQGPKDPKPGLGQDGKPESELVVLESSGLARVLFCGGFDFVLTRQHKSKLTDEEKGSLSSPLDKIEIKLMAYLPDVIRKHAATASPIIELVTACSLIYLSRAHEITPGPASDKKDNASPEKKTPEPEAKKEENTNLPLSLQPINVEDKPKS
jgi:hypothetical protein